MPELLTSGPPGAAIHLLLAHGAGAPMTSPFMEEMTRLLVQRGLSVSRFEFAYMAERRVEGGRRPPPKAELLLSEYEAAVTTARAALAKRQRLVIGGKSMGGRVASMVADKLFREKRVAGLVAIGYPFHPPERPEKLRTAHLAELRCPMLIVQGEHDPFGTRGEVAGYTLSSAIGMQWCPDGDHDLKPPRGSSATRTGNLTSAAAAIHVFCRALM